MPKTAAERKRKALTALQILKAARKLLSKPERWIQHSSARSSGGLTVKVKSPDAVGWCAIGAIRRCDDNRSTNGCVAERCLTLTIPRSSKHCGITGYNDAQGRSHKQIMTWFDRAIKRATES